MVLLEMCQQKSSHVCKINLHKRCKKDLAVHASLGYSLDMETLFSAETNEALALLAKVTANFEALAIRTGEADKALIQGLKEDKKNFDDSKKFLA